jgi:hypothetical protein
VRRSLSAGIFADKQVDAPFAPGKVGIGAPGGRSIAADRRGEIAT